MRIKHLSIEPALVDDVVKAGVGLVVVIFKEVGVIGRSWNPVLKRKFGKVRDVLAHLRRDFLVAVALASDDAQVVPLAVALLAGEAVGLVVLGRAAIGAVGGALFFNVHFEQFDEDFLARLTLNQPATGGIGSVRMSR